MPIAPIIRAITMAGKRVKKGGLTPRKAPESVPEETITTPSQFQQPASERGKPATSPAKARALGKSRMPKGGFRPRKTPTGKEPLEDGFREGEYSEYELTPWGTRIPKKGAKQYTPQEMAQNAAKARRREAETARLQRMGNRVSRTRRATDPQAHRRALGRARRNRIGELEETIGSINERVEMEGLHNVDDFTLEVRNNAQNELHELRQQETTIRRDRALRGRNRGDEELRQIQLRADKAMRDLEKRWGEGVPKPGDAFRAAVQRYNKLRQERASGIPSEESELDAIIKRAQEANKKRKQ